MRNVIWKAIVWLFHFIIPPLEFVRVRDVKRPERGTSGSAGIDFFVPYDSELVVLRPHKRVIIPSGIHVKIPPGFALFAKNKSSVGTKKGLDAIVGTIDQDYQGEIGISLLNTGHNVVIIKPGEKIVQFVLMPVFFSRLCERECTEEMYLEVSERGTKGFGEGSGR